MGYLLKEALKTICSVNQWSYAVFWKFGCQNPKLLIWEECYYEPLRCCVPPSTAVSVIGKVPMGEFDGCLVTPENQFAMPENHAADKIESLIDKMMIKDHINIVGEGIIGRAAFTGNHLWILSSSYNGDAYPPEIMENVRFVDEVRSLILRLGFVQGSVCSDTYATKLAVSLGMPAANLSGNGFQTSNQPLSFAGVPWPTWSWRFWIPISLQCT
ncbi:transcription factor LHW isoform X2 [Eucalyptus grandis]|uniref:transcription factor LHW isoform X2 n=1 Tax=Eucalyptus grandis TaxID=71139 RepID=UPI000525D24C|nr:transcription factor LHW isoform X2 [Eucalyptus grandis]